MQRKLRTSESKTFSDLNNRNVEEASDPVTMRLNNDRILHLYAIGRSRNLQYISLSAPGHLICFSRIKNLSYLNLRNSKPLGWATSLSLLWTVCFSPFCRLRLSPPFLPILEIHHPIQNKRTTKKRKKEKRKKKLKLVAAFNSFKLEIVSRSSIDLLYYIGSVFFWLCGNENHVGRNENGKNRRFRLKWPLQVVKPLFAWIALDTLLRLRTAM